MNTPRMLAEVILQPLSTGAPAQPIQTVTAAASPMTFTAPGDGTLSLQAGSLSLVTLTRGGIAISLGSVGGLIPVAAGDKVTLNYLTAPTINFIPR